MLDNLFDFSKRKSRREALFFYWQLLVLGAVIVIASVILQALGHALAPVLPVYEGERGLGFVRGIAVAETAVFYLAILHAKRLYVPVVTAGFFASLALACWFTGLLGFILPACLATLPARQPNAPEK